MMEERRHTAQTHRSRPTGARKRGLWFSGEPLAWACGAATGMLLLMFLTLLVVVTFHGLRAFWPSDAATFELTDGGRRYGVATARDDSENRWQIYIANRDLNELDYLWLPMDRVARVDYESDMVLVERVENGPFLGKLTGVDRGANGGVIADGNLWSALQREMTAMEEERGRLERLQRRQARASREMERLRDEAARLADRDSAKAAELRALRGQAEGRFEAVSGELADARRRLRERAFIMSSDRGKTVRIAALDVVRAYRPNHLGLFGKLGVYLDKLGELLTASPRASNTEGGLFPAIFGTVMMVFLMSVFCAPLGVLTAVYLREYAKAGVLVNLTRIAVNNLAGVPSIVYGIFGLGFFVYGLGGAIDRLFFAESLPSPTFGTGGLLWASLTMALLTVPVVIVSTEEGLDSVPQNVRDGSLALGATKFQTLTRVVLPMASPGMLTGLILAIARAAGEVAPLMLVGVVKIAPSLPVDGEFPYLHLERKFMHLGFHIFDVGFQSPNVEAALPMVYVTTLLLLFLVLGMSFLAMRLRNRMKKRYSMGAF